jgi:hypothetical protein
MCQIAKRVKRAAAILVCLFVIGWIVRVVVPYSQSRTTRTEVADRRARITLLLSNVYNFASTHDGEFPNDLTQLQSANAQSSQTGDNQILAKVDLSQYIYKRPAPHERDRIRSDVVVIAENEIAIPGKSAYFVGLQGNWVVLKALPEYRTIVQKLRHSPGRGG